MNQIFGHSILLGLSLMLFFGFLLEEKVVEIEKNNRRVVIEMESDTDLVQGDKVKLYISELTTIPKDSVFYFPKEKALSFFSTSLSKEEISSIQEDSIFSDVIMFNISDLSETALKKQVLDKFHSDIKAITIDNRSIPNSISGKNPQYPKWIALLVGLLSFFLLGGSVKKDFNKHKENLVSRLEKSESDRSKLFKSYFSKSVKMSLMATFIAFALWILMFYLFMSLFDMKITNFTIVNCLLVFLFGFATLSILSWFSVKRNLRTL